MPNARVAFAKTLALFFPEQKFAAGIHPTAVIAASAKIDPTAHVGPHCVVGERVKIGANSVLQGGNFIGDDSKLGDDVNLFPNVTIYPRTEIGHRVRIHAGTVIGSDGFGYVLDDGIHRKVPQIGNVVIGDDVEIGSNVSVDRGALGSTVIGKGTKIDNLVQIAHNVEIGEHCIIIAQVGIAGSTKLGKYVILAGQAGIARTFENRQSGHRWRAVRRHARYSRRRKAFRLTRTAGKTNLAPIHHRPTPARTAQARCGAGKENSATNDYG